MIRGPQLFTSFICTVCTNNSHLDTTTHIGICREGERESGRGKGGVIRRFKRFGRESDMQGMNKDIGGKELEEEDIHSDAVPLSAGRTKDDHLAHG